MTKTTKSTKKNSTTTADLPEALTPISADLPCGPNLEYDQEYIVLKSALEPKSEVQYGDFRNKPEEPDWVEIERDCKRLLLRTRDITLMVSYIRARTNLGGAAGLRQGLEMLHAALAQYPQDIHPQLEIEGVIDPEVRANALAALADPDTVLADIRGILVNANTAYRLPLREVERAFASTRATDALDPGAVRQQLADLHSQEQAEITHLARCAMALQDIDAWAKKELCDDAPNLSLPVKILGYFLPPKSAQSISSIEAANSMSTGMSASTLGTDLATASAHTTASPGSSASAQMQVSHTLQNREQVRAMIRAAKEWLEHNEPSSPVAILLKQAERLLGKRFAEVAQAIPPELLARWDADE